MSEKVKTYGSYPVVNEKNERVDVDIIGAVGLKNNDEFEVLVMALDNGNIGLSTFVNGENNLDLSFTPSEFATLQAAIDVFRSASGTDAYEVLDSVFKEVGIKVSVTDNYKDINDALSKYGEGEE